MTKNALVLGGGGALGVAWETGLLAGLREAGIDPGAADLVVGTSAGSIVGTVVAAGRLDDLIAQQREPTDPELASLVAEVDLAELMKTFARWAAVQEVTLEATREIGGIALAAKTASEDRWISYFKGVLPVEGWPERPLKLTSVEASSGRFAAWDRGLRCADLDGSGVKLRRAWAVPVRDDQRRALHRRRRALGDERGPGGWLRLGADASADRRREGRDRPAAWARVDG